MKRPVLLFLAALLVGCPGRNVESEPTVSTPLKGAVFNPEPIAHATIEVFDFRNGRMGERYAQVESDATGQWSADLGEKYGDYWIRVSNGGLSVPLETLVVGVEAGETRNVVSAPINHLVAQYSRWLFKHGASLDEAHTQATQTLNAHFGGFNHARVHVWVPERTRTAKVVPLTDGVRAHLLSSALGQLAARLGQKSGLTEGGAVNRESLLAALSEDILADGVFDGLGFDGRGLMLGNIQLDGSTLRAAYGVALARFLESNRNQTGLNVSDFRAMIEQIANSRLPVFVGPSTPLHLDPPAVALVAPTQKAFLRGGAEVRCKAQAGSHLTSMEVFKRRQPNGTSVPVNLGDAALATQGAETVLTGTLNLDQEDDGWLELQCTARDENDAIGEATSLIFVNNRGSHVAAEVVRHQDGTVRNETQISCICDKDEKVSACRLVEPSPAAANVRQVGEFEYLWDTRQENEGDYVVACEVDSHGFGVARDEKVVLVDNLAPGSICGYVFVDTPVNHAKVEVFTYAAATKGAALHLKDAITDENGSFCTQVADTYRGPVLVVASGSDATYQSAVTGKTVRLNRDRLALLFADYVPGRGFSEASLNVATTLAAELATVNYHRRGDDTVAMAPISRNAHEAVTQLLRKQPMIPLGETVVRDFVTDGPFSGRADMNATLLGLFHVGLSRLSAEIALSIGYPPEGFSTLDLTYFLLADLADGVFDGLGADGTPVYVSRMAPPLTADTLRCDLARAIARWLNNVPVKTGLPEMNRTSLRAADFTGEDGLLATVAQNAGLLFPQGAAPRGFDTSGPALSVRLLPPHSDFTDGEPAGEELGRPLRGCWIIDVRTTDDSGVDFINAEVLRHPEALGSNQLPKSVHDQARFVLDTAKIADGDYMLQAVAVDAYGNSSSVQLPLHVENTAPTIAFDPPIPEWSNGSLTVSGHASKKLERLIFEVDGAVAAEIRTPPMDFARTLEIPCGKLVRLAVRGIDLAGNEVCEERDVKCDAGAPTFRLTQSIFRQEASGAQVDLAVAFASGTVTLEKRFDLLDYLPDDGLTAQSRNLPTLAFVVDDTAGDAAMPSPMERLKVEYQYNHAEQNIRPWTPLASTGNGLYELPIAYQTLLPQGARPHDNFLVRVQPTDVSHAITVRVTDLAGNVREQTFSFALSIVTPPAYLHGCELANTVAGKSLAAGNLHTLFEAQPLRVFDASFNWPLALPGATLVPFGGLNLHIGGGMMDATVTRFKIESRKSGERGKTMAECPEGSHKMSGSAQCSRGFPVDDELTGSNSGVLNHMNHGWAVQGRSSQIPDGDGFFNDLGYNRTYVLSDYWKTPNQFSVNGVYPHAWRLVSGFDGRPQYEFMSTPGRYYDRLDPIADQLYAKIYYEEFLTRIYITGFETQRAGLGAVATTSMTGGGLVPVQVDSSCSNQQSFAVSY